MQRGRLAPAAVSRRPASKWEREKASQLSRSAASAHQHIITSFPHCFSSYVFQVMKNTVSKSPACFSS
ncbi:unnamed protein product [Pylaiella littoralis]